MRSSNVAALLACVLSGCFPPPHLKDAHVDVPSDPAADATTPTDAEDGVDAVPSNEADTHSGCASDADCKALDALCAKGTCGPGGTCVVTSITDAACDDGDTCTRDDRCVAGACTGEHYACDDSVACTNDLCDGDGGCAHPVAEGQCFIGGACVDAGTANPENSCEHCAGGHAWTAVSDVVCDDANACTIADHCADGMCVGGGTPDDQAGGDWLVIPAEPTESAHSAGLQDLFAVTDGVVGQGSAIGKVTFADVGSLVSATATRIIVGLSAAGQNAWAATVEGTWRTSVLGEFLDGTLAVVPFPIEGLQITVRQIGTENATQFEPGVATPWALVALEGGNPAIRARYSHEPVAIDGLDRVYCLVDIPGVAGTVQRDQEEPWPIHPTSARTHELVLVRFEAVATNVEMARIRVAAAEAGSDLPYLWLAGPVHVAEDGRVLVPFGGSAGTVELSGPGPDRSFASVQDFVAVAIIDSDGAPIAVRPVVTGIEHPSAHTDLATLRLVPLDQGLLVVGSFEGREVVFGDGAHARSHTSHQTWTPNGPIIRGAGGEGFFGVLDVASASLVWFGTLAPSPTEQGVMSSYATHAVRSPNGFYLLGGFGGLGAIRVGSTFISVAPPANGHQGTSVVAEFMRDGRHLWSHAIEQGNAIAGRGTYPAYLTGGLAPGTNGVGPTAIEDLNLDPNPRRSFIQRFDSAGGLSCGAAGANPTP